MFKPSHGYGAKGEVEPPFPPVHYSYFSPSPGFRPNHRRFFGFGASGSGVAGVSSLTATGFSSRAGSSRLASFSFDFGSASLRLIFFSAADFSSVTWAASTHSRNAIAAESLLRWPSFTIRV